MLSGDLLGHRTRLTPSRVALVERQTGRTFRYRDLNERANRLSNLLTGGLGLQKGDRLGVLANNCVEFIDSFYAAGKTGIVLVPISWRLTPHELRYVLNDCAPRAVIFGSEFAGSLEELREELPIEHWLALGAKGRGDDLVLSDALSAASTSAPAAVKVHPEDTYAVLYTSGTTGRPKGAMIPHRMVAWNGYNTVACWGLRPDDVSSIFTPMYHAGALGAFLGPLFTIGGRLILHRGFDPADIWYTIEREGVTVALGVPTIWKMLAEAPEFREVDLQAVRWLACGGAPLPRHIIETYQQRGIVFKQGYGMTEVGVNCFSMTVEESYRKAGSVGKPFMFTEVRLVDKEGRDVPTGGTGELLFRGPHVFSGYWNNPEATAEAIDSQGWFHTGDLARADEEGFFYIVGRSKDMFISGGVNVYPAEIEGELVLHPKVADAAVVGVPDETWGEVGVAFVVATSSDQPAEEELREFLGSRLARYKIPKRFIYVDELPRTAYGKVVKSQLRDRLLR